MIKSLIRLGILLACSCMAQAQNTPSIKIALAAPFTGAYSAYGTLLLSGAMQAITDLNAHGGVKGIPLEIVPLDDECDADVAVKLAASLGKEKQYQAVIGHVCSAATLAASNIYARANILMLTPTSTNDKITERKINTVFRMTGTDHQQSIAAASFIANTLKSQRVAVLHDQELYSKDLADAVSEQLLHLGVTPVLYQGIARGTKNFTPIIKKLHALQADAVYFAGLYPEVAALTKTLNVLQLQIPVITADGIALNKFISQIGSAQIASSVLMTFADNPGNMLSSQTIINRMQANHMETSGYALYAYAAVQVLAQAIDATNTTDGLTLANWLHQNEVDTVLGKKSWDTNGNVNNAKYKVYSLMAENKLKELP